VKIRWQHNHPINAAAALKHRAVSDETKSKLVQLFHLGHSAVEAHENLRQELLLEDDQNFVVKSADRAVLPDKSFCHRYIINF
jgi:hypothetical protein